MEEKNAEKIQNKPILIVLALIFIFIIILSMSNNNEKEPAQIAGSPTIIYLGTNCYTCNRQRAYLDVLKEKYNSYLNVKKIDIYESPLEAKKYEVKATPTLIFLDKDGNQVDRYEELLTDSQLEQKLIDLKLIQAACKIEGC